MKAKTYSLLAFAILLAGCSKQETQSNVQASSKAPEPLAVRTAAAEIRQVDRTISVTGSLHPDESVNVSAEVPGRIASIPADFGQFVRKGQVVAELDKQELNLQVERARATLAQALARLGLDPNQDEVTPESTPAIRQATAQMEDARSKFENAQRLIKTGDIAQERYTELEKALRARQAALEAAKDEMRTQWASVQGLRADVKLAQKRLGDATIRAPFDGAVSAKLASPGQYMKENTPILTIVKSNPIRLRVDVPENAAGAVRIGTTLTFTTDAAPGVQFQAAVRELNPSLDPKARSLTAEARLVKADNRLRPGMFVQVQLVLSRNNEIVVVPKQALYNVAGLTKLFVISDGKAHEKRITPGQDLGGFIEVPREHVNAGDRVAVSALTQLVEGLPVKTQPSEPRASASGLRGLFMPTTLLAYAGGCSESTTRNLGRTAGGRSQEPEEGGAESPAAGGSACPAEQPEPQPKLGCRSKERGARSEKNAGLRAPRQAETPAPRPAKSSEPAKILTECNTSLRAEKNLGERNTERSEEDGHFRQGVA